MYDTYNYWNNLFSPTRYNVLNDWTVSDANHHPKLEGYLLFTPITKSLTDNISMIGIPSFCREALLTLPYNTVAWHRFAFGLYVLPGERQLRTKRDFNNLHTALTAGHTVKVRTSTDRVYYLNSSFILNDKKEALTMPYSFYSYNPTLNIGYKRIRRELYVNPALISYKHDYIKKMVVNELLTSLGLFNFPICIQAMDGQLINFNDINKEGYSLSLDNYHDMLADMLTNRSFINSVIDNL